MKCSSRSIRSLVSIGLWLLLLTAPLFGGPSTSEESGSLRARPSAVDEASAVGNAIERAVRARVGATSVVSVTKITGVRLVRESASLVAVPDPSGRIGAAVRFVLAEGHAGARTRIGEVTATVQVSAPAVRTRKAFA